MNDTVANEMVLKAGTRYALRNGDIAMCVGPVLTRRVWRMRIGEGRVFGLRYDGSYRWDGVPHSLDATHEIKAEGTTHD